MFYEIGLIYCLAGIFGGILMGIVGFGIGPIVVPIVAISLKWMGVDNEIIMKIAIATSLSVIIINTLFTVFIHSKTHNINYAIYFKLLPGSLLGAAIGSFIVLHLPAHTMKHCFAMVLFIIAIIGIFNKPQEIMHDWPSTTKLYIYSCMIAIISNIIGVSDGILMVPFLRRHRLAMPEAVGTATALILPVSVVGLIPLIVSGIKNKILLSYSLGYIYLPAMLLIAIASIVFSYYAIKLSKGLSNTIFKNIYCIVVMGLSLMMIF